MKRISVFMFALVMMIGAFSQVAAQTDSGVEFLPVTGDSYEVGLSVAPKIGILGPATDTLDAGPVYGAELAVNCLLLDLPGGTVRTGLSYNYYDDSSASLSTSLSTIELSPVYFYQITDRFSAGIGPGAGFMMLRPDGGTDIDVWGVQAVSGVRYVQGLFYAGLEARYQWNVTDDDNLGNERLDNYLIGLKVGVKL